MVIDFSAKWCGPCKMMEPALRAMADKYPNVDFIKIDVDELSVSPLYIYTVISHNSFLFLIELVFYYPTPLGVAAVSLLLLLRDSSSISLAFFTGC